jgi:hypothetical protein
VSSIGQQNYQYLRLKSGAHPEFPPDPNLIKIIKSSMEEQTRESGKWSVRQFRSLIAGATFYLLWQFTEMALRTPDITSRFVFLNSLK